MRAPNSRPGWRPITQVMVAWTALWVLYIGVGVVSLVGCTDSPSICSAPLLARFGFSVVWLIGMLVLGVIWSITRPKRQEDQLKADERADVPSPAVIAELDQLLALRDRGEIDADVHKRRADEVLKRSSQG